MYESPKLVPINTINAAYGNGAMSMGLCVANVNAAANANAAVNVAAAANVAAAVNAAAAANAVAVALVVCHFSPIGNADPRGAVPGKGSAAPDETPPGEVASADTDATPRAGRSPTA